MMLSGSGPYHVVLGEAELRQLIRGNVLTQVAAGRRIDIVLADTDWRTLARVLVDLIKVKTHPEDPPEALEFLPLRKYRKRRERR